MFNDIKMMISDQIKVDCVPQECIYSHAANIYDLNMKTATKEQIENVQVRAIRNFRILRFIQCQDLFVGIVQEHCFLFVCFQGLILFLSTC